MALAGFPLDLGHSSSKLLDDLEGVTCPICLEIYEKPMTIACGHSFCNSCLGSYANLAEPQCPLCRKVFDPTKKHKASALEKLVSSHKGICKGCSKKMSLSKLRSHSNSCPKLTSELQSHTFRPVAHTSQHVPSDLPNRSTFRCPYCGIPNMDSQTLVKHCNEQHMNSSALVVCPVCSSMPWGDPGQKSTNFIQHLNLRHQFEYDTFVDFQQDDNAMLQAAIQASLQQL